MDTDDRQAAWYRAVRDGTPRGRHYGAPLEDDPIMDACPRAEDVAEIEPEPPPVNWDKVEDQDA